MIVRFTVIGLPTDICFSRPFYVFKPPRSLSEIDTELKGVTDRILTTIGGLSS